MNILPLFKTHYSISRSILTAEKASDNVEEYPLSIFTIARKHNLKEICVVDDSMSGILEISTNSELEKIKLIFGLRISISENISIKDNYVKNKLAKYVIFCKNVNGYKNLIKISSFASVEGFNNQPIIDFVNLKRLWNDENLILAVPFYDSFLHLNSLEGHIHVPDFSFTKPIFLLEDNDLPFDFIIENKVMVYCKDNGFNTLKAQSVYYYSPEDYEAFVTFKCIGNKGSYGKKATCEKPELNHCCSDKFNFLRTIISK